MVLLLIAIIYCVINIYNFVTKKLYFIILHNVLYLLKVFQKLYNYFIYTVFNGYQL